MTDEGAEAAPVEPQVVKGMPRVSEAVPQGLGMEERPVHLADGLLDILLAHLPLHDVHAHVEVIPVVGCERTGRFHLLEQGRSWVGDDQRDLQRVGEALNQ